MAQITGPGGDGSRNLFWENSVPCAVGGSTGCKTPWLFLLALAAAVLTGKKKSGR